MDQGFHEFISKPFRDDEIFSCLSKLLGVEFTYEVGEDIEEESINFDDIDLSLITLPKDLYVEFKNSVDICNITEIERLLINLNLMGGDSKVLAGRFEQLLRKYELEEIVKILEQVNHE